MTVHDLSPWLRKDASPRVRRRVPVLLRARIPTMIVTPSEAVRRAVISRFRIDGDRVVAVPLAASSHFKPVDAPRPERPYFLFVGILEARKNITRLIEAWREVRKSQDVDLVLAGRARDDFAMPEPEEGLRILGAVREEDLPALYSSALAFVYPSLYEGFGLPVLEAMQCGTTVITSARSGDHGSIGRRGRSRGRYRCSRAGRGDARAAGAAGGIASESGGVLLAGHRAKDKRGL